ncbi:MAG: cytochrome c oxidase subunit II [Gemmatimonadetes bacterium]|nr:cytochrome c oxidase subunit II [Gemmatimonadota bacterium]
MSVKQVAAAGALAAGARQAVVWLVLWSGGGALQAQELAHPQTTFHPVSAYGASQNAVFANTLWWTLGILALVVVLTLYAAIRFRERPDSAEPRQIHGNTALEITWTLIPAVIVVLIAVPTVRTIFENQQDPPADALQVEVVGHQWWWEFRYPAQGVVTANQLYLPVGRPIELKLHSADVIHSFWIPRIGGKRDVNPQARAREGEQASFNRIVFTIDSAGHYPGQCAEYCGDSHAIMRMSVQAVPPAEFDAWVAALKAGDAGAAPPAPEARQVALAAFPGLVPTSLPAPTGIGSAVQAPITDDAWAAVGRQVFLSKPCTACHTIQGTPALGALGPNLTRVGARPYIGAGAAENTLENLERWIRDPQSLKPGALMPGAHRPGGNFPPTNLSEAEITAIAHYLRSLR